MARRGRAAEPRLGALRHPQVRRAAAVSSPACDWRLRVTPGCVCAAATPPTRRACARAHHAAPNSSRRRPEPHILLFRRPNGTDPTTGLVGGKRIDPSTGEVIGLINLAGLLPEEDRLRDTDVLNGIAIDPVTGSIWVTGKRWPWLFEITLENDAD